MVALNLSSKLGGANIPVPTPGNTNCTRQRASWASWKGRIRVAKRSQYRREAPSAQSVETTATSLPPAAGREDVSWFYSEAGQKTWVDAMELDTITPDTASLLQELGVNYDPQRLADALESRSFEINARAVKVAMALGRFLSKVLQDYATGRLERNMEARASELRGTLAALGPSFVKIGQALSARPDLLPRVYLERLSSLQDRLPSFPNPIAMRLIEEELGRPPQEIFSELSEEPVAAASLGQVYKGRLRSGEVVAVKVQRPGIADSIAVDMLLLRRLISVVDRTTPEITQDLVPLVDEFAKRLFGELDYEQEGRNCERFTELYGYVPRIRTPKVHWEFTSRRVLTMEWIDGVKLTDKEGMDRNGLEVVDFVDVGIECTLRQLLEHGYFHADPHPGNLLACANGDLVYLDFGMMSEAPPNARYAIISHVVHLVNRDYLAMCEDYYELEFMDRSVDTRPIAPALADFFDDVLETSVSKLNFRALVDGLGDVFFKYPFTVPPYYALILRSLTVLEGLALQADPEYKLLAKAYPYMARRLLTDPSPRLRASLESLVLRDGQIRWNRLDNLLREGSKSSDFDPEQLWVLADWLFSPSAQGVREPLADEVVRLVDTYMAGAIREQIGRGPAGVDAAKRLVPMGPKEEASLARSRSILQRLGSLQPARRRSIAVQGNGPFGTMTPQEFQRTIADVREGLLARYPRVQQLLSSPGAQEMLNKVSQGLLARATARTLRLVLGIGSRPEPESR